MERARTRRWGPGKAAAVRRLYEARRPITQVELAAHAKVSQPAVSQYLANLSDSGDAAFSNPGWLPVRDRLHDTYRSHYSSRFTEQSAWYRIDPVTAQVTDLVERYPSLIISGDVAADLIRPWRVPTVAIVYGEVDDDAMDGLGFVRADSASTASVLVRPIPDDRFDRDAELREGMRIAPLLHLVADLIDLGGDDRADAAERFASILSVRDETIVVEPAQALQHDRSVARTIEIHRVVLDKLLEDPGHVLEQAEAQLAVMHEASSDRTTPYLDAWRTLLDGPRYELVRVLTSTSQHDVELLKVSPFATLLTDEDRAEVARRAVRRRASAL